MAKDCWLKEKVIESNVSTSRDENEWDFEALFVADKKVLAVTTTIFN